MSFCGDCGYRLQEGDAFCPRCGRGQSPEAAAEPALDTQHPARADEVLNIEWADLSEAVPSSPPLEVALAGEDVLEIGSGDLGGHTESDVLVVAHLEDHCPRCGVEVRSGQAFCQRCGASLSPAAPQARPLVSGPARPSRPSPRPAWLLPVAAAAVIVLAAAGVGAYMGLRSPDSTQGEGIIRLMSDVPPAEEYLVDPEEPIYTPEGGFSDDAVKVLTQVGLQLALEQYRIDRGSYPASLGELFPVYAPVDQNGQELSAPPEGHSYAQTGGGRGYDLSVTLSAGRPYTVNEPKDTIYPDRSGLGE